MSEAPGRINAHTHLYSGLAPLGMPAPEQLEVAQAQRGMEADGYRYDPWDHGRVHEMDAIEDEDEGQEGKTDAGGWLRLTAKDAASLTGVTVELDEPVAVHHQRQLHPSRVGRACSVPYSFCHYVVIQLRLLPPDNRNQPHQSVHGYCQPQV